MTTFIDSGPKADSNWRGIILLGRNVQSYKFALARSLLDFAAQDHDQAPLEELAGPFSSYLCEHLRLSSKQGTPSRSEFLDACRRSNSGEVSRADLLATTVRLGFNNVLDAFHTVGRSTASIKFFDVAGTGENRVVHLTDAAMSLAIGSQSRNLRGEVEARWRLVETAWDLGVSSNALATIAFDGQEQMLYIPERNRRRSITGAREAISGYQKGTCFYCFRDIETDVAAGLPADVDHFIPHRLQWVLFEGKPNLDGVWNLVLACQECNRGVGGKSDSLPAPGHLERLWQRNEEYISSHHPLRETLIRQTGSSPDRRRRFLNEVWQTANPAGAHLWSPVQVAASPFQASRP